MFTRLLSVVAFGGLSSIAFADASAAQAPTEDTFQALPDDGSQDTDRAVLFETHNVQPFDAKKIPEKSMSIPQKFLFPRDVRTDTIKNVPRKNSIFGIDISHYSPADIDFDNLKLNGVNFIYVKAIQGVRGKDGKFAAFWTKLGNLSSENAMPFGAYVFLSSLAPGKDQADAFADYLALHEKDNNHKDLELPPVMDLEWDATKTNPDMWVGHAANDIVAQALACLHELEARTGRKPVIYTDMAWWGSKTIPPSRFQEFKGYKIWIADYNRTRKLSETPTAFNGQLTAAWQFAADSEVVDQPGSYDSSIFYGTDADFKKMFGLK